MSRFFVSAYESEDIAQSVFIKVNAAKSYPNPKAFSSWVMQIARNEYVNYLRKNKFENELNNQKLKDGQEHGDVDERYINDNESISFIPDHLIDEADGMSIAIKNDLADCVKKSIEALRKISLDKALIIEWYLIDELSSKEISEVVNKTDAAVRRAISDARLIMKKLAKPCYEQILRL
jgi:RNA polymerase sigma factor (sigma-70 family)